MRTRRVLAIVVLGAFAAVSATGCSGCRKTAPPPGASAQASASASASAPAVASAPFVQMPGFRPGVAAGPARVGAPIATLPAAGASGAPLAGASDAIFDDIAKANAPAGGEAQSFRALAVTWAVPPGWITEDYVPASGRPQEKRRTSRSPSNTAFFDVLEANVENQAALMWKGNPYPTVGLKPDGGPGQRDWTPFATVGLGKLSGVGSHYADGTYTYAWIFFTHPRTKTLVQVILTWPSGDDAARRALSSIAASVAAD